MRETSAYLWIFLVGGILAPCLLLAQRGDVVGVHDPSVIEQEGTYYLFSTGKGIPVRTSNDLKTWTLAGRVLDEDLPGWAAKEIEGAEFPWAPDISYFNGRYHLYYCVSTFGSQRSVIGLATAPTLDSESPDYEWTDHGKVIESTTRGMGFNAIDPNLVLDEEGQPWLCWGSFHWGVVHPGGILILPIDSETGQPKEGAEPRQIAGRLSERAIEAPYIVHANGYYYLFVSFDHCCRGVDSSYRIMVGRSDSITGPYVDRDGKPMTKSAATLVLESDGERVFGPGHNAVIQKGEDYFLVHHYYDGRNDGKPTLQIRHLTWDGDNWPVAGEPIVE